MATKLGAPADMRTTTSYDVIVVGSGNAGFSAAASAREHGAQNVLIVEKASEAQAGGNSTFTAGAFRTVFAGLHDVLPIVRNVPDEMIDKIDMSPYTNDDFMNDLLRVTNGQTDPHLAHALIDESNETIKWLAANGIQFQLSFNRQAYQINGRYKFWGGMVLSVVNGGKGLTKQHQANAATREIEIRYESPVIRILQDERDQTIGVTVQNRDGTQHDIFATGGVVLCAGGFEANSELRLKHLGHGWDRAYVRGTPHNTGELLELAMTLGAEPYGGWSSCHSTCWDANAPTDAGDQILTNQFTKSGYPLGLMINTDGKRFVDEGLDMRNYTYAKFGREILKQPDSVVFQVWDANAAAWLREEEYADDVVEKIEAKSVEELANKLIEKGLKDRSEFVTTIHDYNHAVELYRQEHPAAVFDPSRKDGMSTKSSTGGLKLDKTNWASPITQPPFLAVKVTCGITFTFGGLRVDPLTSAVMSKFTNSPIPGLYCAGEMMGGLFYNNYPGGSGLTAGAVFGRKAGQAAAKRSLLCQRQNRMS